MFQNNRLGKEYNNCCNHYYFDEFGGDEEEDDNDDDGGGDDDANFVNFLSHCFVTMFYFEHLQLDNIA